MRRAYLCNRLRINPLFAKGQARKYAQAQNCRFIILSNGDQHYLWDHAQMQRHGARFIKSILMSIVLLQNFQKHQAKTENDKFDFDLAYEIEHGIYRILFHLI